MVRCAFCKAKEADQSEYGVPICHDCFNIGEPKSKKASSDRRTILVNVLAQTTFQVEVASAEFNSLMKDIPSGLPHPDGAQRIKNASRKLSAARLTHGTAVNRLNDYLSRGIVPENLLASEAYDSES